MGDWWRQAWHYSMICMQERQGCFTACINIVGCEKQRIRDINILATVSPPYCHFECLAGNSAPIDAYILCTLPNRRDARSRARAFLFFALRYRVILLSRTPYHHCPLHLTMVKQNTVHNLPTSKVRTTYPIAPEASCTEIDRHLDIEQCL